MPENVAVLAVGAAIVLAMILVAFVLLRRRTDAVAGDPDAGRFDGPEMLLAQDNQPDALAISLVPERLAIGMRNASLSYRLDIANRGSVHIVGLRLAADMVSAKAGDTEREHRHLLMGPDMGRAEVETIARIDPGESVCLDGTLDLPLSLVEPIKSGETTLLTPFVRMRAVGAGTPPRRFSFVVGFAPEGDDARLEPVALDKSPRVWRGLSARLMS